MAAAGVSKWKNDPHSVNKECAARTGEEDQDVLEEPFAQAVLQMGYPRQAVLQAIRGLQKSSHTAAITAERLMQRLMNWESNGRTNGASARESLKRPASDHYSSDGESDQGSSMEYEEDDLQTDGAAVKVPGLAVSVGEAEPELKEPEPREPPVKKASLGKSGKGREELCQLLRALREENRRLKARQLCRNCQTQPVSITFLPCGHFSFCYECGQGFQACPLCQKTILADVRTFLA